MARCNFLSCSCCPPHQGQDGAARAHHRQGLDGEGRLNPQQGADLGDGARAGVATSSGRAGGGGNAGWGGRDSASSTLAAYPAGGAERDAILAGGLGAMNSCEPAPPIMPGSLSTT